MAGATFYTEEPVENMTPSEAAAQWYFNWALCHMGHKPPENFGEIQIALMEHAEKGNIKCHL